MSQSGRPIPRRENELKGTTASPMVTYFMSPEEIQAKYGPPVVKKAAPRYEMTKEQYLAKRMAGKSRRDIAIENFGNHVPVFKRYLHAWGLLDAADEKAALKKLAAPEVAATQEPREEKKSVKLTKERSRGNKYNITKEMVQAAFAQGKTIREIEDDNGMPKNSLFYHLRKWDIRSPNRPGSVQRTRKKQNSDEVPLPARVAAPMALTAEEIQLLRVVRSVIDKVVSLYDKGEMTG